jgi:GNAT superfamily N-acetyltransferase
MVLEEVGVDGAVEFARTYRRVFVPHGSAGRASWSDGDWARELAAPGVDAWIACTHGEVIGLLELETEPSGDVGIVVLGVVPEVLGKGYGGALLTLATRAAWQRASPAGRVWVQTSARDHPNALRNYEARGFRRV